MSTTQRLSSRSAAQKALLPVSGALPPGIPTILSAAPQNLFRAEKFFIPEKEIAESVLIQDFRVGTSSCGILYGGLNAPELTPDHKLLRVPDLLVPHIPGVYFWAESNVEISDAYGWASDFKMNNSRFSLDISFYAAEVGQLISVQVLNKTDTTIQFRGVFYGTAAR